LLTNVRRGTAEGKRYVTLAWAAPAASTASSRCREIGTRLSANGPATRVVHRDMGRE